MKMFQQKKRWVTGGVKRLLSCMLMVAMLFGMAPGAIPVVPVRHGDIEDQLLPRSGERVHGKQEHCAFFRLFAKDTGRHPYFPIQKIGDVVHMILLSLVDAGQPAGRKPNVPVGLIT